MTLRLLLLSALLSSLTAPALVATAPANGIAATTAYSALLRDHVHAGAVHYTALRGDPRLDAYLAWIAATDPATLPHRNERLAYWINTYNAATLRLITDHYPVRSIMDLAKGGRYLSFLIRGTPWDRPVVVAGGRRLTLNQVEHAIIRKEFADEPRIHFVLVCAARSCPPLRSEAYTAERLETQLTEQTRAFLADERHNRFDVATRTAHVSALFKWYARDFGPDDQAVLRWIARWAPSAVATTLADDAARWRLRYVDYDWSLNGPTTP
jgi:Protein of unknown function, DUF547